MDIQTSHLIHSSLIDWVSIGYCHIVCFRFHSSRKIKQQGVEEILSVFAHLLLGLCVQRLYIIGPERLSLRPWDVWQWPNYILHLIRHLFDLFWATVSIQRKVLYPKPWLSFAQEKRPFVMYFPFILAGLQPLLATTLSDFLLTVCREQNRLVELLCSTYLLQVT